MYHHHRKHIWGLFSVPRSEWQSISDEKLNILEFGIYRMLVLAAIPAISFLIGVTQLGWSLSGTTFNTLSLSQAAPMALAFYLLIVLFTLMMTYFTFTMERSYGETSSFSRCLLFVTYSATPMYLAGVVGLVPIVWLCVALLLLAVCYSVYLLYLGIPIYMHIDTGKGYVVSTSIITAGLCMLVVFNALIVVFWASLF
jgi:hypothetical protein